MGQSLIVGVDIPATGQIVQASVHEPYLVAAVELDIPLLRDLAGSTVLRRNDATAEGIFAREGDPALTECMVRLPRLCDEPEAVDRCCARISPALSKSKIWRRRE